MKIKDIIRIFRRNWLLILAFPLLMGFFTYLLTANTPKTYTSDFLLYTGLASSYKLTSEENPRIDHFQISNAYANLMSTLTSRETLEEVGLNLLAYHLMVKEPDESSLSKDNFQYLKEIFPKERREKIVDSSSFENTVNNLKDVKNQSDMNPVKALLFSESDVYGVPYMQKNLEVTRKEESDMIQVFYTSNDPAVSTATLNILADVFIDKYKNLKEKEINNVVDYFQDKTEKNRARLKKAEENLKNFGIKHNIINFDDQSSNLTSSQQSLEEGLQREKMTLAAAEAALAALDKKIGSRANIIENNHLIMKKREELSEINQKIANADLKEIDGKKLLSLKNKADNLKKEIEEIVHNLYQLNTTPEGIQNEEVLQQYLSNLIVADESSARIAVMEDLEEEYQKRFDEFAPLGATLSALEREVRVAEEEYLQSLTALNTNQQKQKDLAISNNIKLVDSPKFPFSADPTKRMLLVAGAAVAGLVLTIATLIGRFFFNEKIRTPSRAEKATGLELAGVFPLMPGKKVRHDYSYMDGILGDQCASSVVLATRTAEKPVKLMVTGTRPGEGKIRSSAKLACKMANINGNVLFLYPKTEKIEVETFLQKCPEGIDKLKAQEYSISESFTEVESFKALAGQDITSYSYVITVIPSLSESQMPIKLLGNSDLPILVTNASRKWSESDKHLLNLYEKACEKKPVMILNKVTAEDLEEIWGKLPLADKKNKKKTNRKPFQFNMSKASGS